MRVRLDALVREKCGRHAARSVPLVRRCASAVAAGWPGATGRHGPQAAASLQQEFGLPLGLLIIDTIAASAGYTGLGAENDNAINQRLMNVLKFAAQQLDCFVLGIDHFGKDVHPAPAAARARNRSGDLVLACLGERELSGRVFNLGWWSASVGVAVLDRNIPSACVRCSCRSRTRMASRSPRW